MRGFSFMMSCTKGEAKGKFAWQRGVSNKVFNKGGALCKKWCSMMRGERGSPRKSMMSLMKWCCQLRQPQVTGIRLPWLLFICLNIHVLSFMNAKKLYITSLWILKIILKIILHDFQNTQRVTKCRPFYNMNTCAPCVPDFRIDNRKKEPLRTRPLCWHKDM